MTVLSNWIVAALWLGAPLAEVKADETPVKACGVDGAESEFNEVFSTHMDLKAAIELCMDRVVLDKSYPGCVKTLSTYLSTYHSSCDSTETKDPSISPSDLLPGGSKDSETKICTLVGQGKDCLSGGSFAVEDDDVKSSWNAATKDIDRLIELLGRGEAKAGSGFTDEVEEALAELDGNLRTLNIAISGEFGLVVRGGVSMGAYQAGFLYYLTAYLREYRSRLGLKGAPYGVVAGSSAGGINSYIAAVEGCQAQATKPSDSLFYLVWMNLGLTADKDGEIAQSGLYDLSEVGKYNLFSSKPFDELKEHVGADLSVENQDRWRTCDVALGLTTTRVKPREIELAEAGGGDALMVPQQVERFGFRVSSKGDGNLLFENLRPKECAPRAGVDRGTVTSELRERYPQLALESREMLMGVLDVAVATGAFPLAFAPVKLRVEYGDGARPETVSMVDGGTFDNHPFRFAARLRRWKANSKTTSSPDPGCSVPERDEPSLSWLDPEPHEFIMLEPTLLSYPDKPSKSRDGVRSPGVFKSTVQFAADFMGTARSAQLAQAADELPYLRIDRKLVDGDYVTRLPARSQPISGEHLGRFLAFVERDFRDFDYAVGMADARSYVREHAVWSQTAIHKKAQRATDELLKPAHNAGGDDSWEAKVALIESTRQRPLLSIENCDTTNFRRLVCAASDFENDPIRDLEAWFQLLAKYNFEFEDLVSLHASVAKGSGRLNRHPGWDSASETLRIVLGRLTDRFAAVQTGKEPISGSRAGSRIVRGVLRAGLDYALDGAFAYSFDRFTMDLSGQGGVGMANGRLSLGGAFTYSHLLVHRRVAWYHSSTGSYTKHTWYDKGFPSRVHAIGVGVSPVHVRIPAQYWRGDFAPYRGLVSFDVRGGPRFDLYLGGKQFAFRAGLGLYLGTSLLRRFNVGVEVQGYPVRWAAVTLVEPAVQAETSAEDATPESEAPKATKWIPDSDRRRHAGFGDELRFVIRVGWRFRPMDKGGWKKAQKER